MPPSPRACLSRHADTDRPGLAAAVAAANELRRAGPPPLTHPLVHSLTLSAANLLYSKLTRRRVLYKRRSDRPPRTRRSATAF